VGDEIASAASVAMGRGAEGQPAVHVRALEWAAPAGKASELLPLKEMDLFR
jgi:F420-0:gamma-glutamyl ligase